MHRLFFSLLLIFLPTQLAFHFWPDWAMVLGRRVDYLSPTLFFTDILIIFTLGFWISSGTLGKLGRLGIFFIFLFAAVNIFFAANRLVAIYHWIKFVEFALLGYYIVKTKVPLSTISYPLSVGVLYSSIIAIIQFLLQHSIGGPFWLLGERTFTIDTPGIARMIIGGKEFLRPYSTFPHPNVLGGFLAVVLPLIFIQAAKYKKIFYWATMIFGSVALILTFSRSAWIVFGLGMCWIFFKKKRNVFFIPIVCLLSLVAFSFHPQDESVVVRQELNIAAIKIFQSAPFFGVGLGNFLVSLPDHLPSRTIYFLQPVHNIYLLLLSEIGLIGLIGLIWLIRKQIKFSLPLAALLLLGLVDHYLLTLQQGQLLLTLVIALAYRALR